MSEEFADELIRLVEQREQHKPPHSFDTISKTDVDDGWVISFKFDDTELSYEAVILDSEPELVREVIVYTDNGVDSETYLTLDETVEFLYA